jgi:hypothetical protein
MMMLGMFPFFYSSYFMFGYIFLMLDFWGQSFFS